MFSFFFSSRRRHTRCSRDWSSDVCSSDLVTRFVLAISVVKADGTIQRLFHGTDWTDTANNFTLTAAAPVVTGEKLRVLRSEERRVGKECRARGAAGMRHEKSTRDHESAYA